MFCYFITYSFKGKRETLNEVQEGPSEFNGNLMGARRLFLSVFRRGGEGVATGVAGGGQRGPSLGLGSGRGAVGFMVVCLARV